MMNRWCNGEMVKFQLINGDVVKLQELFDSKHDLFTHLSLHESSYIFILFYIIVALYYTWIMFSFTQGGPV